MFEEDISQIEAVLTELSEVISDSDDFEDIPLFYDMMELTPNNLPPIGIVFQAKPWHLTADGCNYERQLDICIVEDGENARNVLLNLWSYSEKLQKLLQNYILTSNLDLSFLQGSEVRGLRNVKEDTESYKGTKTVYASIIVLSYLLRYWFLWNLSGLEEMDSRI